MNMKSFGITIVVFLILSSVVSIIIPKGKMEKTVKFVLSISFIAVIITSASFLEFEIPKINTDNISVSSNDIYSLTLKTTKELLENQIIDELNRMNIQIEKLNLSMDILSDNSIVINKVIYKTSNVQNTVMIEKIIYEKTGCNNIERESNEKYIIEKSD